MNTLSQRCKGVSRGLMLKDKPWNRFTFDLLQARKSRETGYVLREKKQIGSDTAKKKAIFILYFLQILN